MSSAINTRIVPSKTDVVYHDWDAREAARSPPNHDPSCDHVHRRGHLGCPLDVHVEGHRPVADVVKPRARQQRRGGARLDPFQYRLLDVRVLAECAEESAMEFSSFCAMRPGIMWSMTYCAVRRPGIPTAAA